MNMFAKSESRPQPGQRSSRSRSLVLLPPLVLVLTVLVGGGYLLGADDSSEGLEVARDADLCPIDGKRSGGEAVFLFDFTKPLGGVSAALPGELLRDLTLEFERDTEIRAYVLTGSADAPLALLRRFCKPFDTADVQVAVAKDQAGAVRDCDDLPAQVSREVRQSAARFCDVRDALQRRIDVLAANAAQQQHRVAGSYLVEALEDIRMEFHEQPGPHRLHVFSDMMQHAHWYSHLELQPAQWNYEEFSRLLAFHDPLFGQRRQASGVEVDIHYVPRHGQTAEADSGERHRQFWGGYFEGAALAFHEQPPSPAYDARSVAALASEYRAMRPAPAATQRFVVSAAQGDENRNSRKARQLAQRGQSAAGAGQPEGAARSDIPPLQSEPERQAVAQRQAGETADAAGTVGSGSAGTLETGFAGTDDSGDSGSAETLDSGAGDQNALQRVRATALADRGESPPAPQPGRDERSSTEPAAELAANASAAELAANTAAADQAANAAAGSLTPDPAATGSAPNALAAGLAPEQPEPPMAGQAGQEPAPLELALAEEPSQALLAEARPDAERAVPEPGENAGVAEPSYASDELQIAAYEPAPCELQPRVDNDRWQPQYPLGGRVNLGDAVITVRYAVDETGETVDDQTAIVRDLSKAGRVRYFNRFAQEALASVRNWRFSFAEPDNQACAMDVSYVTTFKFNYD